jgi:hypothetical protein
MPSLAQGIVRHRALVAFASVVDTDSWREGKAPT